MGQRVPGFVPMYERDVAAGVIQAICDHPLHALGEDG
jgi:hypothetical protein